MIKRELNRKLRYKCRCDERLKAQAEGSTRLVYTGLRGGQEHLKIETRLIDERFASVIVVYYESRKRELKIRLMNESRCDERLKAKAEGSTRLTYTGLCEGLERLKIETRLIDERFESVMGECEIQKL